MYLYTVFFAITYNLFCLDISNNYIVCLSVESQWKHRLKLYATKEYSFTKGQAPNKESVWGIEKSKRGKSRTCFWKSRRNQTNQ